MEITLIVGLATELLRLFGKGRRAELIVKALNSIPGRVEAFKSAREKIDGATGPTGDPMWAAPELSQDEWTALDAYLDLTRKPKKEIRRYIRELSGN